MSPQPPTFDTAMTKELKQIYSDLSNGRVSQKEALKRVKAIKLRQQASGFGCLLLTPVWQAHSIDLSAETCNLEYNQHHVIVCELPEINAGKLASLLPHSQSLSLNAKGQKNIAQLYGEYALACFERIQTILRAEPTGK